MNKKEVLVLKEKWNVGARDVPSARAMEMVEVGDAEFRETPFPLSFDSQRKLLELIYNRKSGIITRQELINVLYNSEVIEAGKIIRCVI